MLILLKLSAKSRRADLQNISVIYKILSVKGIGKGAADVFTVVNGNSLLLIDIAPQILLAPLPDIFNIINLHMICLGYGR